MADFKGYFDLPQTPAAGNFARLWGVRIGVCQQSLQKVFYIRLEMEKNL
jgi:hypothetical protein